MKAMGRLMADKKDILSLGGGLPHRESDHIPSKIQLSDFQPPCSQWPTLNSSFPIAPHSGT